MKNILIAIVMFLGITACGKKSGTAMTAEEKIAGTVEKTWEATRETSAGGDDDKLTHDEKKERITFWRNGNVKMGDGEKATSGEWTVTASTVTLHFKGENVTENFSIIALTDDKMELKGGDGSVLTLKPE